MLRTHFRWPRSAHSLAHFGRCFGAVTNGRLLRRGLFDLCCARAVFFALSSLLVQQPIVPHAQEHTHPVVPLALTPGTHTHTHTHTHLVLVLRGALVAAAVAVAAVLLATAGGSCHGCGVWSQKLFFWGYCKARMTGTVPPDIY